MQIRSCITGPEDTPYAFGLFFFDALFPQDYPNIPPLLLLATTGGGRVRFNPNLYADGKVCLSLLGTWHGSASEKWDPSNSSLWQVRHRDQRCSRFPPPHACAPGPRAAKLSARSSRCHLWSFAGALQPTRALQCVRTTLRHAVPAAHGAVHPVTQDQTRAPRTAAWEYS